MTSAEWTETVTTPEGFPLRFGRAAASERLVALAIDLGILLVVVLVAGALLYLTFGFGSAVLLQFVLRQGYFIWFSV